MWPQVPTNLALELENFVFIVSVWTVLLLLVLLINSRKGKEGK